LIGRVENSPNGNRTNHTTQWLADYFEIFLPLFLPTKGRDNGPVRESVATIPVGALRWIEENWQEVLVKGIQAFKVDVTLVEDEKGDEASKATIEGSGHYCQHN
jgi:hypothetical protein